MAKLPARATGSMTNRARSSATSRNLGLTPPKSVSPFKEIGHGGVAVFGGQVMSREKDSRVAGVHRWSTYADLMTNTSIVAASVRYFLNIIASAEWTLEPAKALDDEQPSDEAKHVAEFVDSVIHEMETPWRRVMRRSAMYRFNGYGVQEWTAKKRESDGMIGLEDIEARPCHTMDRWEVSDDGTVLGLWQRSPQTGEVLWLPRQKIFYMVEDSLTDSPEGLGLFRHLVDPYVRLQRYQTLEGIGFDRDLRGIPIGRIPYSAINASIAKGSLTETEGRNLISAIEAFVKMQSKSEDTSICLDSAPYIVATDSGESVSGVMQYGLELLQGQQPGFAELDAALQRLNREMARIIGTEHLLLGESAGSRSLSEDKSRNFYLVCNGSLDEISDGAQKDVITPICDLNGIPEELRPFLKHSDVSFRAVSEITGALGQMATAGATLHPNDPAINEIREMLGLPKAPELSPEEIGIMQGLPPPAEEEELPEGGDKEIAPEEEPGVVGVDDEAAEAVDPEDMEEVDPEDMEEEEEFPPKKKKPNGRQPPFARKGARDKRASRGTKVPPGP